MRTFIILAMAMMLSLTSNAQNRGGSSRGGNSGRNFGGSRVSVSVGRGFNGGARYVSNYRGGYRGGYNYSPYRSGFGFSYYSPRYSYVGCDPYYDDCYGYDPYYYAAPRVVQRVIVPVSPYAIQGGWRRFGYR